MEAPRLKHLDTLRVFAVAAVMAEHYSGMSRKIPIGAGMLGVGLFFVLSGFLITSLLMKDYKAADGHFGPVLKAFYIKRSLRLFPAYFLVIAILAAIGIANMRNDWPWHAAYLSNIHAALGNPETVFWSLSVEEQFYVIWPLTLALLPRRAFLPAALAMPLIALLFKIVSLKAGYWPSYTLLPFQLTALGAGCTLAIACFRNGAPFQFSWITPAIDRAITLAGFASLLAATMLWFVSPGGLPRLFLNDLLCIPLFVALTLKAAKGFTLPLVATVFDNPALRYLGRISYGIYLWHNWVPKIIDHYVTLPDIPKLALTLVITIVLSIASWEIMEKHCVRLGHRLAARIVRTDAPNPAGNAPQHAAASQASTPGQPDSPERKTPEVTAKETGKA